MTGFLAQGGYAFYVWAAYAVSLVALGLTIALAVIAHRSARRSVRRLEARKSIQLSETNL